MRIFVIVAREFETGGLKCRVQAQLGWKQTSDAPVADDGQETPGSGRMMTESL